MKLLLLTTNHPSFRHSKAAEVVAATLIESWLELGHRVTWATIGSSDPIDPASLHRLTSAGAVYLGDFSDELIFTPKDRFGARIALVRGCIPGLGIDYPYFRNPKAVSRRLHSSSEADVAILFWDTWFEHLAPTLDMPTIAYWARPRYASALDAVESEKAGLHNPLVRTLALMNLRQAKLRHLARSRLVSRLTNICAIDATLYRDMGIPCTYIPNTWPDPVGNHWWQRRKAAETDASFLILGAMGSLIGAGTLQGIRFWVDQVLPRLENRIRSREWSISICGRNADKLPDDLQRALLHPRIKVKGFVSDIDQEMLRSHIFLMCNNAGSYTGGYTRVVYAMATGSCMVAHRRIALSMPEVRHGENALLGESGEEIVELIAAAIHDSDLRRQIREGARRTYETVYHPKIVAQKLANMASEVL